MQIVRHAHLAVAENVYFMACIYLQPFTHGKERERGKVIRNKLTTRQVKCLFIFPCHSSWTCAWIRQENVRVVEKKYNTSTLSFLKSSLSCRHQRVSEIGKCIDDDALCPACFRTDRLIRMAILLIFTGNCRVDGKASARVKLSTFINVCILKVWSSRCASVLVFMAHSLC